MTKYHANAFTTNLLFFPIIGASIYQAFVMEGHLPSGIFSASTCTRDELTSNKFRAHRTTTTSHILQKPLLPSSTRYYQSGSGVMFSFGIFLITITMLVLKSCRPPGSTHFSSGLSVAQPVPPAVLGWISSFCRI